MLRDQSTLDMVNAAVRHKQVMLAFQPVVQSRRPDRMAFYEGLIRVLDETGRIIPARDFINVIEDTETGRLIDCLALEKGLRTLAEVPTLRLSINMSARSIGYRKWMRVLEHGLKRDATVAERLILEVTESSAMMMPEIVVDFMSDLQQRGISFALDDFGAGQTALRYFKSFQFDILKIDGQFIHKIHADPDNQVLTQAMLAIAQQFDMFTVAEFVENAEDAQWLTAAGVDCLQGYFFGAPTVSPPWIEEDARRTA
ncbi:EAL domain-containing protein [Primorskyibacter aestuariivivens]|uniref:EAL domain-containing protein n=1 Tax=Primorskyibacter aestuariivivens TaxID=1888912 RepID=UPI0022FFDDFB|nr:EAL domain-containing protein [Primorskyibacter aestuariivivens]MDA7428239.1 EAL domain-containing protein [Primorskyibacter aestuariivivens]